MPDYIPTKDLELQAWLANFLNVANASLTPLGITDADLASVQTDQNAFGTALASVDAARSAYDNAVETKKTSRQSAVEDVRVLVRRIQANPAVTNALKASLGITVRDAQPAPAAPIPPAELSVTGRDSGVNELRWDRSGNRPGTQFVIEALIGSASIWGQVDVVTTARYSHTNRKPGERVVYRVCARRAGQVSNPSNQATVYAL